MIYSDIKYIEKSSTSKSGWYFNQEVQKIRGSAFDFEIDQVGDATIY